MRRVAMRVIGLVMAIAALAHPAAAQPAAMTPADVTEFDAWKQRYLLPDGRVIDTGNDGISHSEGQSYGLLFTQSFGDRENFDRILSWTRIHLSRPYDLLFAWRYKAGDAAPVTDLNNATDGDIVIAWALLRAGAAWHDPAYTALGQQIAAAILRLCVAPQNGRLLLLPAEEGFVHQTSTTINLSYYIFAGIRVLAQALPDPRWQQLDYDGRHVLAESRFGAWNLPPDWENFATGQPGRPADGWPARFSWDAVRVPVHAVWGGIVTGTGPVWNAARFWTAPHAIPFPAWTEVLDPATAPYSGNSGVGAVATLASAAVLHQGTRNDLPSVASAPNYYAASLIMLSRLAWVEALDNAPASAPYPDASAPSPALQADLLASGPVQPAPPAGEPGDPPTPMTAIASQFGWRGAPDAPTTTTPAKPGSP